MRSHHLLAQDRNGKDYWALKEKTTPHYFQYPSSVQGWVTPQGGTRVDLAP